MNTEEQSQIKHYFATYDGGKTYEALAIQKMHGYNVIHKYDTIPQCSRKKKIFKFDKKFN